MLKLLYNKNELFMKLLKVFEKQKRKEMSLKEIVEEIINNMSNLFCSKNKKEEVLKMNLKALIPKFCLLSKFFHDLA